MNASRFAIAAAQCDSTKGDIIANVRRHCEFVARAKEHQADVVVFPELSLIGYEPTIAAETAIDASDEILRPLADLADELHVTIIVGFPIRSDHNKPFIGAVAFQPNRHIDVYRKRFVFTTEEPYFIASNDSVVCSCNGRAVAIAICADINNPLHAEAASKQNPAIYAAGVAMTPEDIGRAESNMSKHAKQYGMLAVMANYASATGGYPIAGRSGIWNEAGNVVAQANGTGECLIFTTDTGDGWTGEVVSM